VIEETFRSKRLAGFRFWKMKRKKEAVGARGNRCVVSKELVGALPA
jgi:hypothetical protein